jgi:hypothetical protein
VTALATIRSPRVRFCTYSHSSSTKNAEAPLRSARERHPLDSRSIRPRRTDCQVAGFLHVTGFLHPRVDFRRDPGGKVWRLRFRITRADGNRVEHAIVIGTHKELPTRAAAREFVKSLYLPINHPAPNNTGRPVTFSDIAGHYIQEELTEDQRLASVPKAHSTTATYGRYLRKWVLLRWGDQAALMIQPLDLENWLKELGNGGLGNQTRSKIRQVIGLVYKHAQRVGASENRGIPNKCFEMWWPGTELNRRRQPFQGCVLPPYPHYFFSNLTLQSGPSFVTIL